MVWAASFEKIIAIMITLKTDFIICNESTFPVKIAMEGKPVINDMIKDM